MGKVLKIEDIKASVEQVAEEHGIKRVTLFGSYADGKPTNKSDIDLIVNFINEDKVTLFTVFGVRHALEDITGKSVDVIHGPIPKDHFLEINKEVLLYG